MQLEEKLFCTICAIAKNENLYLREWVEHYKNLGIDCIYLYDNNDPNGERFNSVIQDYISSGFVRVYDFRGKRSPQISAYRECYMRNSGSCKWMMFVDCDEFLFFDQGMDIHKFLSKPTIYKHDVVLINWKIYDDNNLLVYDPRPVVERFTHQSNAAKSFDNFYSNYNCKSIVKCGTRVDIFGCHIQRTPNKNYCNTAGTLLKDSDFDKWFTKTNKLVYDNCHIKHYVTKTAEEFYKRRIIGTRPAGSRQLDVNRRINQFFSINAPTPEKHLILEQDEKKQK